MILGLDTGADPADHLPVTLDLVPLAHRLAARHSFAELYLDSIHATALANRAYAAAVADRLEEWLRARSSPTSESVDPGR